MTHNMVDAMGTGGLEGMLSSACEITNRVMRSHTEQLISVLKPFLYDPLVMWTGRDTKADENSEMTNNQVSKFIKDASCICNMYSLYIFFFFMYNSYVFLSF